MLRMTSNSIIINGNSCEREETKLPKLDGHDIPLLLCANRILREFAEKGLLQIDEHENGEVKVKYLTPEQVTEMIFGKYNLIPKKE